MGMLFFFFYLLNHDSSCQLSIGQKVRDERKWGEKGDGRRKTAELLFRFQAPLQAALKEAHLGGKITGFHKSATVSHFRADATKASTQTPPKEKRKTRAMEEMDESE